MPSGWRIAEPEYASTIPQILFGESATLGGGRRNSKGARMVYLGSSIAQAALEMLVHIHRPEILAL